MLAELRTEKAAIDDAIAVLERLALTRGKRRGRPPAWMSAVAGTSESGNSGARVFSAETRRKMAEAQRRRWAAHRKAQQAEQS